MDTVFQEVIKLKQSQIEHKHRVFRSSPEFLQRTLYVGAEGQAEVHELRSSPVNVRLEAAEAWRLEGNDAARGQDFAMAMSHYERALGLFVYFRTDGEDRILCVEEGEQGEARGAVASLFNNIALCCLRLGRYNDGVYSAAQALDREPYLVKAVYRRAMCHAGMENTEGSICLERAVRDLELASSMDPSDGEVMRTLISMKRRLRQRDSEQRGSLRGMFDSQPSDDVGMRQRIMPPGGAARGRRGVEFAEDVPTGRDRGEWEEAAGLVDQVLRQRQSGMEWKGAQQQKDIPPPPALQWLAIFAFVSVLVAAVVHYAAP
eukprot:Hpha_TRINITY_DN18636_c0_g1::TRINITY_DN18636_c0_g1_i1::g.115709::m.115709